MQAGASEHAQSSPALERGRQAFAQEAWRRAFEALASADRTVALGADDLELLARSAYMLGHDDDYVSALERAHHAHLNAGDTPRAVRCAIWIGHSLLFRGEMARMGGWFARGQRLLDEDGRDCVERGYLLIPIWLEQMGSGEYQAGYATAGQAVEIGERFGDADLVWLARDDQARALLHQGYIDDGLRLVNEALIVAAAGELSPIVTGIVYCNTIAFCRDVYELRQVREWTDALTAWCERQPEMVAHNALCLVHRAEMRLLQGSWRAALEEARRSAERFTQGVLNKMACGKAFYCQGEVHRLRGQLEAAEDAYREASRWGFEPQPGLALLRLAQGSSDAAAATIRRAIGETTEPLARAALLPGFVEIMLAAGDIDKARDACRELERISGSQRNEVLVALWAQARGAVALAEGDASDALIALRQAMAGWSALDATYEEARVRTLVGLACEKLGDDDTAMLELDAARAVFAELGAEPDQARIEAHTGQAATVGAPHGLTARELDVLRQVAAGKTNREIAADLVISEHTVARHIQNIFHKLGVSSRTAAGAFAYSHDLL